MIGLEYLPRRHGILWWKSFDRGEVREELAQIAAWGVDAVRIPLIWEDFQPSSEKINHRALDHLGMALDAAGDAGLRVLPVLFVGPLHGVFCYPQWAIAPVLEPLAVPLVAERRYARFGRLKPLFTDPHMLEAQRRFVRECVGFYSPHPAILGWDMGSWPEQLPLEVSRGMLETWLGQMLEDVGELAPQLVRTWGLGPGVLTGAWPLPLSSLLAPLDRLSLHLVPYAEPANQGTLGVDFWSFVIELTRLLAGRSLDWPGFGIPTAPAGASGHWTDDYVWGRSIRIYLVAEEEAAELVVGALAVAYDAGAAGCWVHAYADHPDTLDEEPPYDSIAWARHVGLVRADGSEKPAVAALTRFAARLSSDDKPPRTGLDRQLSLDLEAYANAPDEQFRRLYDDWREGEH
ncbi:MAG TPA: hypothetical protein EYP04_11530 [Anaerolineae bacterium]|nr:hypothetical protein [Anaerolineae bacterium]HIQ04668.1 hypothetical protein [Anaerolineae bacterium]